MARIRNAEEEEEEEEEGWRVRGCICRRGRSKRQGGQRTAPWGQRQETLTNVNKTCRWQGDGSSFHRLSGLSFRVLPLSHRAMHVVARPKLMNLTSRALPRAGRGISSRREASSAPEVTNLQKEGERERVG